MAHIDLGLCDFHVQLLLSQHFDAGTIECEHTTRRVCHFAADGENTSVFDADSARLSGQVSGHIGIPVLPQAIGVVDKPLDGRALNARDIGGLDRHVKFRVCVSVGRKRPTHLRDGVDCKLLLIGVYAATAVREDSFQLVIASLPELQLAALRAQVAGHHLRGLDQLTISGQSPVQHIVSQFLKLGHEVDGFIRVECRRQVETSLADGINLNGIRSCRLSTKLISRLGDEGVEARLRQEPMAASFGQFKRRSNFFTVAQDCPVDGLAVPVALVQNNIHSLIGVACICRVDLQSDDRIDLDRLRVLVLTAQLVGGGCGQFIGANVCETDIATLVVQGTEHIVLHSRRSTILSQGPRHISVS